VLPTNQTSHWTAMKTFCRSQVIPPVLEDSFSNSDEPF
jgi:hypothetical protein